MSVEYHLRGVPPHGWISRKRVVQIACLVVAAVAFMAVMLITRSVYVFVGIMVALFVAYLLVKPSSKDGTLNILHVGAMVRSRLADLGNWDGFEPSTETTPFLVPAHRMVAVAQEGSDDEVAVVDYGNAFVCALEVSGNGEGVRSALDTRRLAQRDRLLHKALASRSICLDQIDWVTMVRPREVQPDVVKMGELVNTMGKMAPEPARRSVMDATAMTAYDSVTIRSWVVLRFNADAIYDYVAEPPFTKDSGVEAAYDALAKVRRIMTEAGYSILNALSPMEYAALTRAILDPSRDPGDMSGCVEDDMWPSMPAWRRAEERGATIRSMSDRDDGPWLHATGAFARADLPEEPVNSRWLEAIVSDDEMRRTPRVLVTQVKLLQQHLARQIAQSQKTSAAGRRYKMQRDGNVNVEEAELGEDAATEVAGDIMRHNETGIVPMVRLCISASTARELRNQREHVDNLVQSMGAVGLTWDDERPGPGLLHILPLGLEIKP